MIGILPAAGKAERIHGLPKFLLPVGDSFLLELHVKRMLAAGCKEVLVGATWGNDQIVTEYVPEGAHMYVARDHETMTATVRSARYAHEDNWHEEHNVLFGMPDTYWEFPMVYKGLAYSLDIYTVVMTVFRARPGQHRNGGMCRINEDNNRITEIIDKPENTDLEYIWGALAWRPEFWQYLKSSDAHVGFGVQRAIEAGVEVRAVYCEGGYWDCGEPASYFEMIRAITEQGEPA